LSTCARTGDLQPNLCDAPHPLIAGRLEEVLRVQLAEAKELFEVIQELVGCSQDQAQLCIGDCVIPAIYLSPAAWEPLLPDVRWVLVIAAASGERCSVALQPTIRNTWQVGLSG
jgi:hypothetical protein